MAVVGRGQLRGSKNLGGQTTHTGIITIACGYGGDYCCSYRLLLLDSKGHRLAHPSLGDSEESGNNGQNTPWLIFFNIIIKHPRDFPWASSAMAQRLHGDHLVLAAANILGYAD
ncbi:hypothetical protein B9Z19DRAFT_1126760 [Tuber borchii]|uniref:Uncharacterized protein n=1 Tax=Tuber borchii TaxID=42251 RepID=A0A2T6ZSF2_TUBBO|nr:hypothetical protein B9Z19DRAFT_1126760 [Tuber borchii]